MLIGASGSGKSTLLRCVNLLEVVDDGVIELAGTDITDPRVNADEVRSRVGIVFQAFNLFPHLRYWRTSPCRRSRCTACREPRPRTGRWRCSTG